MRIHVLAILLLLWTPLLFSMEPPEDVASSAAALIPAPPKHSLTDELAKEIAKAKNLEKLQDILEEIDFLARTHINKKELLLPENEETIRKALASKLNALDIPLDISKAIQKNPKRLRFIVQALIRAGAPLNKQDTRGYTPLMHAAQHGDSRIILLLINAGADLGKEQPLTRHTALEVAQRKKNKEIIQILQTYKQFFVNLTYDDFEKTKELIGSRLNVNVPYNGWLPLSYAAYYGKPDLVQLLLENGAHVNARDELGLTALNHAVIGGHKNIAELLLKYGATLEKKD